MDSNMKLLTRGLSVLDMEGRMEVLCKAFIESSIADLLAVSVISTVVEHKDHEDCDLKYANETLEIYMDAMFAVMQNTLHKSIGESLVKSDITFYKPGTEPEGEGGVNEQTRKEILKELEDE